MRIFLSCRCGHQFRVPRPDYGARVRCPECGRQVAVPSEGDEDDDAGGSGPKNWLIAERLGGPRGEAPARDRRGAVRDGSEGEVVPTGVVTAVTVTEIP